MILCDTGIIVAAINRHDRYHVMVMSRLKDFHSPLVTSWPCITEAMHLVGTSAHPTLLRQIERNAYRVTPPTQVDLLRACQLVRRYADAPMDFADASLVAAAETLGIHQILTLDGHFRAYLINDNTPFEILI